MKTLILFLTIMVLSCHENDRVPEYPEEVDSTQAYTGTKGYTHPMRFHIPDSTQEESIDFVSYHDSVFIRIVKSDYSSVKVVHKASISDTSDAIIRMWNAIKWDK